MSGSLNGFKFYCERDIERIDYVIEDDGGYYITVVWSRDGGRESIEFKRTEAEENIASNFWKKA